MKKSLLIACLASSILLPCRAAATDDFSSGMRALRARDFRRGAKLLRTAADAGDGRAQYELGRLFRAGKGVSKDDKEAARLYRLAAEQGFPGAMNNLGAMYAKGSGVPKDDAEAVKWYRKAADKDLPPAQSNLGWRYYKGLGVTKDYAEAFRWFLKSAEHGYPPAQSALAHMYWNGRGTPQDYVQAYRWLIMAASRGQAKAEESRGKLFKLMTRDQVAQAQKLAAASRPERAAGRHETEEEADTGEGQADEPVAGPAAAPPQATTPAPRPSPARTPASAEAPAPKAAAAPAPEETAAPAKKKVSIASDVDEPKTSLPENPANFALVVGIEGYSGLPPAEFAERDAASMKKHLRAMGYPERNIVHLAGRNATRSKIQAYLEEWLPKNVKPESTVFFYFSGHGAPDAESKQAYLVPWDGDARFLQSTAYPLAQVYAALDKLPARSVVAALDACFSGAGGRSVLAPGLRPLVAKVSPAAASGRLVLFTAASGEEVTGSLPAKGHGLFTYYFLKGLDGAARDGSGRVTAQGLYEYMKPLVEDEAHRQNRSQSPGLAAPQSGLILRGK